MPRDRVLSVEEVETLWKWLDTDALSLEAADILELELLLGARCGEISGLRVEEIDRQKWIWTLPPSRSKNGRQRVTPILGVAREMLEQRLSDVEKGPLFLLEKGVVETSAHIGHYLLTRRATLPIAVFTSHDLRRTFATMLAEMGIALDLVAAIVGHEFGRQRHKDARPPLRAHGPTRAQGACAPSVGRATERDCFWRGSREGGATAWRKMRRVAVLPRHKAIPMRALTANFRHVRIAPGDPACRPEPAIGQ